MQESKHPATPRDMSSAAIDPQELEAGLVEAARLLRGFYDGLDERRVSPAMPIQEIASSFTGTLGEAGVGLEATLKEVEADVLPQVMAVPHPRYLGLINSSPMAGGIVADSLISGLNNNSGAWQQGPAFVSAEHEVLRCFKQLLGLEQESSGIVLPGGSYATLHALQLAREAKLPQWRERGPRALAGDPRVYVSEASHFSSARAAMALGVAKRDVLHMPCTGRGQLDAKALGEQLRRDRAAGALPFALVATLGTTGTGAMDALPELIELCREHDLWLHVDACYGGAAALLEELQPRFEGIEQADSVAVDPHKWFFIPMVAGLLFTKHVELELRTFDIDASYIPAGELVDGYRRALPTSRRSAGFAIWMALRAHGLATVREAVRRNIEHTRSFEDLLTQQGFRVMPGGELSVACARWEPAGYPQEQLDELQGQIAAAAVASGQAWFGTVLAQGASWLRFNLVSNHMREEHLAPLAEELGSIARGLRE